MIFLYPVRSVCSFRYHLNWFSNWKSVEKVCFIFFNHFPYWMMVTAMLFGGNYTDRRYRMALLTGMPSCFFLKVGMDHFSHTLLVFTQNVGFNLIFCLYICRHIIEYVMAAGKWIGGFLGFISSGPLGALAGFALGWLFDQGIDAVNTPDSQSASNADAFGNRAQREQQMYEGQRNSFLFSLLVLAAYIVRADGKVMHSEMELVRNFLRQNFGSGAVSEGESIMLRLFDRQKKMGAYEYRAIIGDVCRQIAANMDYAQRLQLVHFLVMIARADGHVAAEEVAALKEVSGALGISAEDMESMLNLRNAQSQLDAAYKVLGIPSTATDDEVKSAYRKMALKHHPDRVAALGEELRKAAEQKFQEINEAKEQIYKARGI